MNRIVDTEGITFEEYVSQKASTLKELTEGMQSEIEKGNDLFAKMYEESISDLEKDLANMSYNGACVLDCVKARMNEDKTTDDMSI